MKKVMKFVKGNKKEEETPVKTIPIEAKKVVNEKVDETSREDDFISRDKSITKLHKAVWNENSDKLKSIIKTYDIDITDKLDRTALYFAVLKNNPNIVNLLLENSANQNIPDIDGITPFLKSVQLGYKQCAANLLNHGADLKKTDKDSNSCLHFAAMGKQSDMLSFLLEYNADCNAPNANGDYPLHIAIQMQDKQMVELLLSHNSDINVVNNAGLTPLMLAEQQDSSEIVELLENCSLKQSKDNNLFPDEISHKSSYENVNTPKIEQKDSPNPDSDGDTWNDSPITTPSKKHKKPLTKVSKFFNDEIEITEEKSESDVSVKCSQNTSPQSGIIPPPCKPLRSLEYLQSGLAMENRPVHLLTLGTVRTRHISMTESDHSKNTTPHRYSYQGDLQGDSLQKLPDHYSTADEKGDSVNISVKSKVLSKLECDSTMQSDWGSNESLPLDELSIGGKKEKSTTSSTSKNTSNSGSIRDKSTDMFLQKQFSLLEDYEKNREKRCSVSYEMDLVTVKPDKNADKAGSKLDDIDDLLEDNNRINTQLEKYAGQTDTPAGITKSKSLPRNCEPYNYHKGSFSLPRTLESGKDPFREMRSYGYFKPRSHFSFSLKMLKGEKKSGFIDKLKSMFNKKSQIHLTEQNENGTWLYKKTDNEYYSSNNEGSFSGGESGEKGDNLPTSKTINNFSDYRNFEDDSSSKDLTFSNNEENKVIEKKIVSLNNMSRESLKQQSSSHSKGCKSSKCTKETCPYIGEKTTSKFNPKKIGIIDPVDSIFCEECSEYVIYKLTEAEQNILCKENFIKLLQDQLEQLKNRNIKSINEAQEVYFKYGVATQELENLKHVCAKHDDEVQKLRLERSYLYEYEKVASTYREEAEKWKKQYEELVTKINVEGSNGSKGMEEKSSVSTRTTSDEEKWRNIIQDEVSEAVKMLRENSQVVISSLEKQNKMLETMIEKLQNELDIATTREVQLKNELTAMKEKLLEATSHSELLKTEFDQKYDENINTLMTNNQRLVADIDTMTKLYTDLQKDYEENINKIESDFKKSHEILDDYNVVKEEYRSLTRSLSGLSEEIVKAKENALAKNEELRQQIAELGPSVNLKEFINQITESLETIEMTCECKSDSGVSEQVTELSNSIADVEKINKLNSEIELKLVEVKTDLHIMYLQEQNKLVTDEMGKKYDLLLARVRETREEMDFLSSELRSKNDMIQNEKSRNEFLTSELRSKNEMIQSQNHQSSNFNDMIQNEKSRNEFLSSELRSKNEMIQSQNHQISNLNDMIQNEKSRNEFLSSELRSKNEMIQNQNHQISNLNDMIQNEKSRNDLLQSDLLSIKNVAQKEKTSKIELLVENEKIKSQLDNISQERKCFEEEKCSIKSSLDEVEQNNEDLNKQLKENILAINKLKSMLVESQNRMEKLEKVNQDLKELLAHIKAETVERMTKEWEAKTNKFVEENDALKQLVEKERSSVTLLKQHINSLQFYHDNEVTSSNIRLKELEVENSSQKEVEKLTNVNKLLRVKIETIEDENKLLNHNITELNREINALGDQLQDSDILQDPKKYVDALDSVNKENMEMKAAMNVLREILEVKLGEKVSDVLLEATSSRKFEDASDTNVQRRLSAGVNDDFIDIDLMNNTKIKRFRCNQTDCPILNPRKSFIEKVTSIEKKIDKIVDDASFIAPDVTKTTSMPNLEDIGNLGFENMEEIMFSLKSEPHSIVRKSSSLDNVIEKTDLLNIQDCYETKWSEKLQNVEKLRSELAEILYRMDENNEAPSVSCSEKYKNKYKEIIYSLQRQVNDLEEQSASKKCNIRTQQEEIKELRGQIIERTKMEEELDTLRRELYKQKVERITETEIAKIKREAELLAVQQELKAQYLNCKQELLLDLTAVQNALHEKHEEEMRIKKKCDDLVKEISANQDARKKKLEDISLIRETQPVSSDIQKNVICNLTDSSQQSSKPQSSGYPEKPVKPHALVINARKKLNSLEKHRLSTESVPESNSDDELKKKYLLQ